MLKIINNLHIFFEDCYQRYGVREYARKMHISPPTASKILQIYEKESLLKKEKDRQYILYYANKESKEFILLSQVYWNIQLRKVITYIETQTILPTLILFGSLSKGETKKDSDIDLALITLQKNINLIPFEKKLKRKIQLFSFSSITEIKNKELANNIINGRILVGRLSI